MGGNQINKIVFSKGDAGLRKLYSLSLSSVSISDGNNLFQTLSSLSSLQSFELWDCNISGRLLTHELPTFKNLTYLSIINSDLKNILNQELPTFKNLTRLKIYDIIHYNFLQMLGTMPSLESIRIWDSILKDTQFGQVLPIFKSLKRVEMYGVDLNNFFAILDGSYNSLEILRLFNCNLTNALVKQGQPTFKNLNILDIYKTHLDINYLWMLNESFNSLQLLQLDGKNLSNTFLEQGICKSLHLQYLSIADNDWGGNLPWCLANLTSLESVDISSNQFTGDMSSSPLKVLTSIQFLELSDNNFRIPISLEPFFNHSKLKTFYAYNTEIYTGMESLYLTPKFQLKSILLSANKYNGSFPKFLYSQYDLEEVGLYNLNLKGEFPVWLLNNNTNLRDLYLFNNSLSGPLQLPNHSHMSLIGLDISTNSFHEHIPNGIGTYLPMLQYLNISRNALHGSIPSSFGDMKLLQELDLSNNLLTGQIPHQMAIGCLSLYRLALSNNSLQGEIC
ncbi:receptor-like protein 9b isoform X2 [Mangifera indica]|uniref:receptor-like protein 9b isoform X2 n=1 Tax=Mangifera indica TaxID=29780 RepID=UPI001CF94B77|nr:receptor-like protein 9b isoform X2 [Mangifera indica]